MNVYKLRDRASEKFINKNRKKVDRIYETKRNAAAAASLLCEGQWQRTNDVSWWDLSDEERRAYRESLIEIVEFELVEKNKQAAVERCTAIIEDFLTFMDDPSVDLSLKEDVRDIWRDALREPMRKLGIIL